MDSERETRGRRDRASSGVGRAVARAFGQRGAYVGLIARNKEALQVAADETRAAGGAAKSIVVSISQQQMWAYEGETMVVSSLVSTGKPGFAAPTGLFSISKKVPLQDMEGLIGGEYYNVTDVPDVMYFTGVGHAFHGTYWHNNFGAVMSDGCVNLPTDIASILYDWTPMYTPVQILS